MDDWSSNDKPVASFIHLDAVLETYYGFMRKSDAHEIEIYRTGVNISVHYVCYDRPPGFLGVCWRPT